MADEAECNDVRVPGSPDSGVRDLCPQVVT